MSRLLTVNVGTCCNQVKPFEAVKIAPEYSLTEITVNEVGTVK